jgi:heme exporter protein D
MQTNSISIGDKPKLDNLLAFLKLYAELFFVFFYPLGIVLLVIFFQMGIFSWLVIALCLTPLASLWYFIARKRARNYLRMLKATRARPWDLKGAIEKYVELQEKQKAPKKETAVLKG